MNVGKLRTLLSHFPDNMELEVRDIPLGERAVIYRPEGTFHAALLTEHEHYTKMLQSYRFYPSLEGN